MRGLVICLAQFNCLTCHLWLHLERKNSKIAITLLAAVCATLSALTKLLGDRAMGMPSGPTALPFKSEKLRYLKPYMLK